MSDVNQRAYLEAMEIPVWVPKEQIIRENVDRAPEFVSPGLQLGPGTGEVLLVCGSVDEPAQHIAADIARSLKVEPVWAWPDADAAGFDIGTAISEHLFTILMVFGKALQQQLFDSSWTEEG